MLFNRRYEMNSYYTFTKIRIHYDFLYVFLGLQNKFNLDKIRMNNNKTLLPDSTPKSWTIITWYSETPIGKIWNCLLCPAGRIYATNSQSALKTSVGVWDFLSVALSKSLVGSSLDCLVLLFTLDGLLLAWICFCVLIWLLTFSDAVLNVSSICWIQVWRQSWKNWTIIQVFMR